MTSIALSDFLKPYFNVYLLLQRNDVELCHCCAENSKSGSRWNESASHFTVCSPRRCWFHNGREGLPEEMRVAMLALSFLSLVSSVTLAIDFSDNLCNLLIYCLLQLCWWNCLLKLCFLVVFEKDILVCSRNKTVLDPPVSATFTVELLRMTWLTYRTNYIDDFTISLITCISKRNCAWVVLPGLLNQTLRALDSMILVTKWWLYYESSEVPYKHQLMV
jgi:hypothetical protein